MRLENALATLTDRTATHLQLRAGVVESGVVPLVAWDYCASLYGVGVRGYHTFGHALDVLHRVNWVETHIGFLDPEAAVVAALFHDAVYIAGAPFRRNEEDSLEALYRLTASPYVAMSRALADRAAGLILATAEHGSLSMLSAGLGFMGPRWDVALFLDCDMVGFAACEQIFDAQNADIDKEFVGVQTPEEYRTKRSKFLQALQKKGVFLTPPFARMGEARAQANLTRELARVDTWMAR